MSGRWAVAKNMLRSPAGILLILLVQRCACAADMVWSDWYNSSPGLGQELEDETLDRVSQMYELPCQSREVLAAQCRTVGSADTFSQQWMHKGNVLHVPCNSTGLVCRDHDQLLAGTAPCWDYQVRFLCRVPDVHNQSAPNPTKNNSHNGNQHYNRNDPVDYNLGANGGFIAMAAGGSVVVPLVCVLVVQLRKSKREERRRRQQARQAAEDLARATEAARIADAPPTYDELFGRPDPVSVISSGALEQGQLGSEPAQDRRGSRERLVANNSDSSSNSSGVEGRVNLGAILETPTSSSVSVEPASPSASPMARSSRSTSLASSSSSSSTHTEVSRTSSASSTDSTRALLSSVVSGNDVIHGGPPPAYDWSGPGHVTVVTPPGEDRASSSSSSTSSSSSSSSLGVVAADQPCSSGVAVTQRRFLGMHLSIFDLMAVIYPDPVSTPPPSYDDALKILGVAKQQAGVQVV